MPNEPDAMTKAAEFYPVDDPTAAISDLSFKRETISQRPPVVIEDQIAFDAINPDHSSATTNRRKREKAVEYFFLLASDDPSRISPEVLDELHTALFDRSPQVREAVVVTLGRIKAESSRVHFEKLLELEDESEEIRQGIISILKRYEPVGTSNVEDASKGSEVGNSPSATQQQQQPQIDEKREPDANLIVLGFFDVLGFSERVKRIGLARMYRLYDEIIELVKSRAGGRVVLSAVPAGNGGMVPAGGFFVVDHAYFSDTIMLWGRYDHFTSLPFYDLCLDFVCDALERSLPIRGCITFGHAIMNQERGVFLGGPIIEGARGETAQQWIGVSFGPSLERYSWLGDLKMVLPFSRHIKAGKERYIQPLALDWPRKWRNRFGTDPRIPLDRLDTDPQYSPYYEKARMFVELGENKPEWWKSYDFEKRQFKE